MRVVVKWRENNWYAATVRTSVFALEDEDSEDSTSFEQFGSFLEVDGEIFKMEIEFISSILFSYRS